jgi:hypothetical protein
MPQRWEVRPTLRIDEELDTDDLARLRASTPLELDLHSIGLVRGNRGGHAVTATFVVEADTPGAAADLGLNRFHDLVAAADLPAIGIGEVVVEPADLDPRSW